MLHYVEDVYALNPSYSSSRMHCSDARNLYHLYFPLLGYLQCIDSATVSLVQKYSLQIQTLSYSQAVISLTANQPVPEGCAVAIASDRCTVNLMLKVRASIICPVLFVSFHLSVISGVCILDPLYYECTSVLHVGFLFFKF